MAYYYYSLHLLLVIVLTITSIVVIMADAHTTTTATTTTIDTPSYIIKYTTITGYFLQDDPATNASTFDYKASNFGLINRTYDSDSDTESPKKTQWQRFRTQINYLNSQCDNNNNNNKKKDIQYKLLYLGRHGEGYHNVAESFYGTPAWDCYWSKLDGNETITWADAQITEKGIQQAEQAQDFWYQQIIKEKIPTPELYYTSPLNRCLATANITFGNLPLPSQHPFLPTVKELLRETIGIHTCDRRSPKSTIHTLYPTYIFEPSFQPFDTLWSPTERETDPALDIRLKRLLDDIFFTTTTRDDHHNKNTFLSLTSHGGAIGGILRVVGHRPFGVSTGGVIPILVKAERIYNDHHHHHHHHESGGEGEETTTTSEIVSATSGPTCTVNPTASKKGL